MTGRGPSLRRGVAPYPDLDGTQACAGDELSKFFPPSGVSGTPVDEAKAICRACPFQHDCLAYALDRPDTYGIWGATTQKDRAELRRRRRTA